MLSRLLTVREQIVLTGLAVSIVVGAATLYLYRSGASHGGQEGAVVPVESGVPAQGPAPKRSTPAPQAPDAAHAAETPETPRAAPAPARIGVAAMGAVRREGLYYLEGDARVGDLIDAAGGLAPDADLSDINLSSSLIDGSTLTIPRRPTAEKEGNLLRYRSGQRGPVVNPSQYTLSGARTQAGPAAPGAPPSPDHAAGNPGPSAGLLDLNTATTDQLAGLPGIGGVLAQRIVAYRQHSPFRSVNDLTQVSGIGEKRLEAVRPLVTVR